MRKFRGFLLAAVLTGTVLGGIYVAGQKGYLEKTKEESTLDTAQQEALLHETSGSLEPSAIDKSSAFEGMTNLYPTLSKREKTKWSKRIYENEYLALQDDQLFEIFGLYELAKQQYYLIGDVINEDGTKEMFQLILEKEDERYHVAQVFYPSQEVLTADKLKFYQKAEQEEAHVAIQYDEVQNLSDTEAYIDYLDQAMNENSAEVMNDQDTQAVTQYVQYALEELGSEKVVADANKIVISKETVNQMKKGMIAAKKQFDQLLEKNQIKLNKHLNTILKVQTEKASFKEPIFIELPQAIDEFADVTGLRILFDKESYLYIEGATLEQLAGYTVKIERLAKKKRL